MSEDKRWPKHRMSEFIKAQEALEKKGAVLAAHRLRGILDNGPATATMDAPEAFRPDHNTVPQNMLGLPEPEPSQPAIPDEPEETLRKARWKQSSYTDAFAYETIVSKEAKAALENKKIEYEIIDGPDKNGKMKPMSVRVVNINGLLDLYNMDVDLPGFEQKTKEFFR